MGPSVVTTIEVAAFNSDHYR